MGVLDVILGGNNGHLLNTLARSAGIENNDLKNVIEQLLPSFSKGIKTNAKNAEGLGGLINALNSGKHQRYLDDSDALNGSAAVNDGNAILGHIFGSKDVSRNVAGHAAQKTGVDSGIIKKLLPLLATAVMGVLSKETAGGSGGNTGFNLSNLIGGGDSSMVSNLLTSFLDADNDGDITDDLLNIAKKFF